MVVSLVRIHNHIISIMLSTCDREKVIKISNYSFAMGPMYGASAHPHCDRVGRRRNEVQ